MAVDWSQAQAAVIGAGLIDARCVPEILAEMRPDDFSGAFLRFFEAFRALSAEQTPIDPVVVLSRIGPEYSDMARDLIDATPTAANLSIYIRICKEQSRLRLLRDAGAALAEATTLADARELLQKAAAVSLETGRKTRTTAMEMAAEWINRVNAGEKPEYVTTGIGCLDSVIHTIPGNYHVIAGYTSHGKSALAEQIALHIAETKKVGYFSFEMPKEDFVDRAIIIRSGADAERVRSLDMTDEELTATGRAAGALFKTNENLSHEDASGFTVDDIRAQTLRCGYEVIFVDYLQNVRVPAQRRYDRFQGVTEISRDLQALAHSLNIVVFAMSQLSRPSDDESWIQVPPLSSLRESGQIEQDADAVIFVHAPLRRQCPRFRVLEIAKNRSGRIDRFFINFDGSRQIFTAPSVLDTKLWAEMMKKRRMLNAAERVEIETAYKEEKEAAVKMQLEKEQRKRHAAERSGGEQTVIEEVKT